LALFGLTGGAKFCSALVSLRKKRSAILNVPLRAKNVWENAELVVIKTYLSNSRSSHPRCKSQDYCSKPKPSIKKGFSCAEMTCIS
jgi:hypothetical protein